jgi:hypothetical protein
MPKSLVKPSQEESIEVEGSEVLFDPRRIGLEKSKRFDYQMFRFCKEGAY